MVLFPKETKEQGSVLADDIFLHVCESALNPQPHLTYVALPVTSDLFESGVDVRELEGK